MTMHIYIQELLIFAYNEKFEAIAKMVNEKLNGT